MKFFYCICLISLFYFPLQAQSDFIHVDQFGYQKNANKVAVISDPLNGFNSGDSYSPGATIQLIDAETNSVVYSAAPSQWNNGSEDGFSGDRGWWFDFSSVNTNGTYYVNDPSTNESSAVFNIGDDVYADVLKAAFKMFYYNRSNMEKVVPYAEAAWVDGPSFAQQANARFVDNSGDASLEKDLSGGWFDAGDYNKYTTFTTNVMHELLWTYKENPLVWTDDMGIPESENGIPDLIDELKYELDWLVKMVNDDGSTILKIGSKWGDNSNFPPSANTDTAFYSPTCSSASIAAAGMLAHASTVLSQFPSLTAYSASLLSEAEAAWSDALGFLNSNTLETNCDVGVIAAGDADWDEDRQRLNAVLSAIYLFEATGNSTYNDYIIANHLDVPALSNDWWDSYMLNVGDALLHYTSLANADAGLSATILNSVSASVSNNYGNFFGFNDLALYRSYMPDYSYHWGSSTPKAGVGVLNQVLVNYNINSGSQASFEQKAEEQIHYFHGLNPLSLVYLTNMNQRGAEKSCDEMYHTWFHDDSDWDNAQSSLYGPPPGYIVGGPNKDFGGPANLVPPNNQPPQKAYLDYNDDWPNNSWEISEPAIYYQSIYLRLLANFVATDNTTGTPHVGLEVDKIHVYPSPTNQYFRIKGLLSNYNLEIINTAGVVVQTLNNVGYNQEIDISTLGAGLYLLRVTSTEYGDLHLQTIIKQ